MEPLDLSVNKNRASGAPILNCGEPLISSEGQWPFYDSKVKNDSSTSGVYGLLQSVDVTDTVSLDTGIKTEPDKALKKKRVKRDKAYTELEIQHMLSLIRDRRMTPYHVSKHYGIPRTTLQYRLGEKCQHKGSYGPKTIFDAEEEKTIVNWVKQMGRKGFPSTRQGLIHKVSGFLKNNPRPNPFTAGVPGRHWLEGFLRRHPELSIRTPEAVSSASATVSQLDIRRWFGTVEEYLVENNLMDVLNDPSRVLNGDESGFSLNPTAKKVLAMKGTKNVPIIEPSNAKQNITVMFSFAANGLVIPPDVILPYKRLSRDILQSFDGSWGIGTSDNGWMDTKNFVLYVKKILHPTLVRNGVKFPVLYFVDGHSSHMALQAADACHELGIVLICLYPNATRILQPADVSIFGPLKASWGKVLEKWRTENPSEKITITKFGPLLQSAMTVAFKKETIVNAFRCCGLFPFNSSAVDYTKCIAGSDITIHPPVSYLEETEVCTQEPSITISVSIINEAIRIIGQQKVQMYRSGTTTLSHEDMALQYIYNHILNAADSSQGVSGENGNVLDSTLVEHRDDSHDVSEGSDFMIEMLPVEAVYEHSVEAKLNFSSEMQGTSTETENEQNACSSQEISGNGASTDGLMDSVEDSGESWLTNNVGYEDDEEHAANVIPINSQTERASMIDEASPKAADTSIEYEQNNNIYDLSDFDFPSKNFDEDLFRYNPVTMLDGKSASPSTSPDGKSAKHPVDYSALDFITRETSSIVGLKKNLSPTEDSCGGSWTKQVHGIPDIDESFSRRVLEDVSNNGSSPKKRRLNEYFSTPETPKRKSIHRNYRQKSYAVLTAAERLQELSMLEEQKLKEKEVRLEKSEQREKMKQQKDEEKRIKSQLKAARAILKEEEKQRSQQALKEKKEADKLIRLKALKEKKEKREKKLKLKQNSKVII